LAADWVALLSFGPDGWGRALLQGAWITLSVAVVTLPFGLALGLLVALAFRSPNRFWNRLATVYTTVFRGLPELLTLYIIYFGFQLLVERLVKLLKIESQFSISPFIAGVVALGLVLAAFSAEVWLGAFNALNKGQVEGAYALGLGRVHTFRHVVWPQLLRVALPGLGNNWMVLLKETSLVSVITLQDTMFIATRASVVTKEPFLFFSAAACLYLIFSVVSAAGLWALERRAARGFVKVGGRA
jgi:polar amino acid transport system permease protein